MNSSSPLLEHKYPVSTHALLCELPTPNAQLEEIIRSVTPNKKGACVLKRLIFIDWTSLLKYTNITIIPPK